MFLLPGLASAEVEFFFNTSPADPAPWLSRIIYSSPLASVGHKTLYISSACYDAGSQDNLPEKITREMIDEEQLALLEAFQDELSSVIGVDMPGLP
jgi:hypothetical protein